MHRKTQDVRRAVGGALYIRPCADTFILSERQVGFLKSHPSVMLCLMHHRRQALHICKAYQVVSFCTCGDSCRVS